MQSSTTCNRHYWNDPNEYPLWLFTVVSRPRGHPKNIQDLRTANGRSEAENPDTIRNPCVRLIIMRIQFRASDSGLVAKINIVRAKSKQASCAAVVLG